MRIAISPRLPEAAHLKTLAGRQKNSVIPHVLKLLTLCVGDICEHG